MSPAASWARRPTSAGDGSHPSRTLSATAVSTARRSSAVNRCNVSAPPVAIPPILRRGRSRLWVHTTKFRPYMLKRHVTLIRAAGEVQGRGRSHTLLGGAHGWPDQATGRLRLTTVGELRFEAQRLLGAAQVDASRRSPGRRLAMFYTAPPGPAPPNRAHGRRSGLDRFDHAVMHGASPSGNACARPPPPTQHSRNFTKCARVVRCGLPYCPYHHCVHVLHVWEVE